MTNTHSPENYLKRHRLRLDHLYKTITQVATKHQTILEIGPAYGHVLLRLKKAGYQVRAAERLTSIALYSNNLIRAGVKIFPYDLNSRPESLACSSAPPDYNVVILAEVLEHLTINPYTALSRLQIANGRTLIATTPNVYRYQNIKGILRGQNTHEGFSDTWPYYPSHMHELTVGELRSACERAGLQILRLERFSFGKKRFLPACLRDFILLIAKGDANVEEGKTGKRAGGQRAKRKC